jgi:hypothetical protein
MLKANPPSDPRKLESDIIYKDFVIYNSTTLPSLAKKDVTYTSPIITDPTNNYISIARFSISHMAIPLYFFDNVDNKYFVGFELDGNENVPANNRPLLYPNNIVGNYSQFGYTNPVFYYEQFIDMINVALTSSWAASAKTAGNEPFIQYDPDDEKFSIYYPIEAIVVDDLDAIVFSGALFRQLQFFKAFYNNTRDTYTVAAEAYSAGLNYYANPDPAGALTNYYYIKQERSALYLLNQIQNIAFVSNKIPVTKEYVPNFTSGKENILSSRSILCDFIPNLGGGRDLSEYQYYPQGPLRLINLESDSPISSIDVQLFFVTKDGQYYPLYLEPGESVSIKFAFMKKSLFNNNYSSLMTDQIKKGY